MAFKINLFIITLEKKAQQLFSFILNTFLKKTKIKIDKKIKV